jgi:Lrp/AsnC family leucine-responsive transcriptional regulator
MTRALDDFDHQILAALIDNARLSNLELSRRIALSHSAIARRIAALERDGVISGYRAVVDPARLGQTVRAFAGVARRAGVPAVEVAEALRALPAVVGCWIVSGDFDILIELAARDMPHYSAIMLEQVQRLRGVAATRSLFILAALKES